MAVLSVIGETLPDFEHALNEAVVRQLTEALGATAPKGCSVNLIVGRHSAAERFANPRISTEKIGLTAKMMPVVWQASAAARPMDGSLMHAVTALAPLRSRHDDQEAQTTVTVQHLLPWSAPHLYPASQLRLIRNFIRRAVKHADVIVTPNYATAEALQEQFGDVNAQVQPFAPLPELVAEQSAAAGVDHAARRAALDVPERYLLTTADVSETGRLQWLADAVTADRELPPVVVVGAFREGSAELSDAGERSDTGERAAAGEKTDALTRLARDSDGQVVVIHPTDLYDLGALISGAEALVLPQAAHTAGHEAMAALANAVPVFHAEAPEVHEIVVDAGVTFDSAETLHTALAETLNDAQRLEQLKVLADDRAGFFSWRSLAWAIWELHAEI